MLEELSTLNRSRGKGYREGLGQERTLKGTTPVTHCLQLDLTFHLLPITRLREFIKGPHLS